MDESQIINDGRSMGLEGKRLLEYVESRRERENKKRVEDLEREDRRMARDDRTRQAELELQQRQNELETRRLELQGSANAGRSEPALGMHASKAHIKLAQYKEGDDIATYLRNFERVKTANGWSDEVALSALINGFSGTKVCTFIDSIPDLLYTDLKPLLLQSFGASIYDLQAKFRYAKQSHEPMSQFILVLNDYLSKMCTLANVQDDFKNLRDFVIKDQLLRSVDKNLADFLKENDIFKSSLDEIVQLAENYQAIHGKVARKAIISQPVNFGIKNSNVACPKPNGNFHSSRTCYLCGKQGHMAKYCTVKSVNHVSTDVEVKNPRACYNCGDLNHFAKFCPRKRGYYDRSRNETSEVKKAEMIGISLSGDGKALGSRLPLANGKCNGKNVTVLRDTGATIVAVKPSLVSKENYVDEVVKIKFADGVFKTVPKALVNIESPYLNGQTEAAIIEGLAFDVLVGNVSEARCACIEVEEEKEKNDFEYCNDFVCAVETRAQAKIDRLPSRSTNIGVGAVQLDFSSLSTKDLISLQQNDATLKNCYEKVLDVSPNFPKFSERSGVLIRVNNSKENLRDIIQQIVLPKSLRGKVLSLAHDTILSGHLGINKTKNRVSNHFFWPGMSGDISRFCRSCPVCQKNNINKPPKAPLINLPVIETPFARVAVDLIGPLPKSTRGNRFALVAIDLATKYPDAVPLKNIDSHTVAEALLDIFSRVGLPNEILHDQGAQFMGSVMKRFNNLLQIKSIHTTPYNPRCNGTCENFNKTLKQMVKKICEDEPEIWDKYLQPLLFAYREVPQCTTGFSPFELIFGHNVRGPLFLAKEKLLENNDDPEQLEVTRYVMSMREKIKEFMKISNMNEIGCKTKQKRYYDKGSRKRNYKLGDKVLLLLPTSTNKLLAEWKGPFEIVRRVNKVDYVIRVFDKERMYHINMLKPFFERSSDVVQSVNSFIEGGEDDRVDVNEELTDEQQLIISDVICKNVSVFNDKPGKILNMSYEIFVDDKVKPISSLPYKLPYALKDKVKATIDSWLEQGIIRKSSSSWCSPAVVVQNKDDSIRLTIDYRKINPHVNVDNYPMPDRDIVIEKLCDSKFLTKLDLTKAYLQMPLNENSRKYTSFVTEYGQFEFCVVPFGIKFASGLCNRVMNEILEDCKTFVTTFVDDLMVHSNSFEEHVKHIGIILSKLNDAGITLNKKKCKFGHSKVKFLGVIVGEGEVSPDPEKVEAIKNFRKPATKKEMRSFLGLLSFYRKFVPNLSKYIAPLTDLLRKKCLDKIVWDEKLSKCFYDATNLISEDISLVIPRVNCPFIIETDASDFGIGAVLLQKSEDTLRPIAFISRKLNPAERNYAVIEKECLAIKWSIDYFHQYLYGGKFLVRTDHAPLTWLSQNKDKNSRLMRWALSLQVYDFSIEYVKGSENFIADFFSRMMKLNV